MFQLGFQVGFTLLGSAAIASGVVLIVHGWKLLQLVFGP